MTVCVNGAIRSLEKLLNRLSQWSICLLHCIELPLRHVFITLDGRPTAPDAFSVPVGKSLSDRVSAWGVAKFKTLRNPSFPFLSNAVIDNLSTDQFYAYRICWSVISGDVDEYLKLLEVGPLYHARWLTLACRILRLYVLKKKPSKTFSLLANFCINVYFPSWFETKFKNSISYGAVNFYEMARRVIKFPDSGIRKTVFKTLERNSFFAHPENVLLCMLSKQDQQVCSLAVNKILAIRNGQPENEKIPANDFFGSYNSDVESSSECSDNPAPDVCIFQKPKLNVKAKVYYKMVNMNLASLTESPIAMYKSQKELIAIRLTL